MLYCSQEVAISYHELVGQHCQAVPSESAVRWAMFELAGDDLEYGRFCGRADRLAFQQFGQPALVHVDFGDRQEPALEQNSWTTWSGHDFRSVEHYKAGNAVG